MQIDAESYERIYKRLSEWVENHPAPDKHIMYIGREQYSPQEILNYFTEQVDPVFRTLCFVPLDEFLATLDKPSYIS